MWRHPLVLLAVILMVILVVISRRRTEVFLVVMVMMAAKATLMLLFLGRMERWLEVWLIEFPTSTSLISFLTTLPIFAIFVVSACTGVDI